MELECKVRHFWERHVKVAKLKLELQRVGGSDRRLDFAIAGVAEVVVGGDRESVISGQELVLRVSERMGQLYPVDIGLVHSEIGADLLLCSQTIFTLRQVLVTSNLLSFAI